MADSAAESDSSTDAVVAVEVSAADVEMPDLDTRIEWVNSWEESSRDNLKAARRDRDYVDNKQWAESDLAVLAERHQPAIVNNYIAPKVNFICGEEIRKRVDPVARPRTPQHEDAARVATDALRCVEEEQKFDRVRSAVLRNMLVEGYGGALKELEECPDGLGGVEYKHRLKHIQWDRLFYDPHSREPDFSDAKYLGVVVWMDLDDAIDEMPKAAEALKAAVAQEIGDAGGTTEDAPRQWIDRKRERVKIVEMYFRAGKDWYRSVFTKGADIEAPAKTWLLDEQKQYTLCPLKMASCYIDQEGRRYGIVRMLISPQDEINKRASKALHLLSVRQVIAKKDKIPDPTKFMDELAKPDGFAEVAEHASLSGDDPDVIISQTGDLAQGHVTMMEQAKADLDRIGPSAAQIPDLPDSASGRAVIARQQAASQEMGSVFDHLLNWTISIFETDWLTIRHPDYGWTEEKYLRVTDDQELTGYRFVGLNRKITRAKRLQELLEKGAPPPKALETAAGSFTPIVMRGVQQAMQQAAQMAQMTGQPPPSDPTPIILQHPLMQQEITENQVEHMLVDIVLDVSMDTTLIAQEQFKTLMDMIQLAGQTRPDMMPKLFEIAIGSSDLPDKRQIRELLSKPPDPKEAQAQEQMRQLQMAGVKAGVDAQTSLAGLNAAKTAETQAKAQVVVPQAMAEIEAKKAQAQIAGAKVPSEIGRNEAAAMKDAASAGERMGGGMMPPMGGL